MGAGKEDNKNRVSTGRFIRDLLSGSIVSDRIVLKNLGVFIFLTVLGALYIGNRFHAEKITRETARLSVEVSDLRAESLSTSASLMTVSRQSEVYRMVKEKELGLEELKEPPFRLVVDK